MNFLPREIRQRIIYALVEGCSMKSISRMFRVSNPTVAKLLVDAGRACEAYHDDNVRNVNAPIIECDEIWSYVYAKSRRRHYIHGVPPTPRLVTELQRIRNQHLPRAGDLWLWTALDTEHRLLLSWHIGWRRGLDARYLLEDVRGRVVGVPQITSDSLSHYGNQCQEVFGEDVHYSQMARNYVDEDGVIHPRQSVPVIGHPDPMVASTSHMERLNLTMRMHMKRYGRKTNAFSKRADRHGCLVAIFFAYYNFCRVHETLGTTPAVAAGLADEIRDVDWIVGLVEARDASPYGPRGPYEPRQREQHDPDDVAAAVAEANEVADQVASSQ